ncbi:MAG: hypothetical protein LBC72_03765 [Spirochaetaceae bacterium]|jgi:hypothetical protein|nr:hypothetical protein [Spirochaetaceae bacterium]
MNTIPSTFSEKFPPYTVLGEGIRANTSGVAAVLLNRAGRIGRRTVFEELSKYGFETIVSVEGAEEHYGLEELAGRFENVVFILLQKPASTGCKINIAAHEVKSPLFFVVWDDMRLSGINAERISSRLLVPADGNACGIAGYKRLCTVPLVHYKADGRPIPTMNVPHAFKKTFESSFTTPDADDFPTLYPYDAAGIYDRARFIALGGFDPAMDNPYWQYLDFGLRAWLWGEEIRCDRPVRLRYEGGHPAEQAAADDSYRRFFLKNLAAVSVPKDGGAHLPLRRFPAFAVKSTLTPAAAFRLFLEIRRWVRENSGRFRFTVRDVLNVWREFLG